MRRLLLVSSSTVHGTGYLDHAEDELRDFLSGVSRLLFVPYALHDREAYTSKVADRLSSLGIAVHGLHAASDPVRALREAEAVFVGGGNTFRLLAALYREELLTPLCERVAGGMRYVGSSAGTNIAGPTIRTTNDMPIVEPPSLSALSLVGFQLNPHYLDPDPGSSHMGETREERIRQYHEENDLPVVGIREGAILRVEGKRVTLRGVRGARVFRKDQEPVEIAIGDDLEGLENGPH